MALDINKVGNYNKKSFIGNSSAKPIVGVPLRGIYTFDLSQGKLTGDDIILPGEPVKAMNTSSKTGADKGLNPNVLTLSKITTDADISGFMLVNETDVIDFGQEAPRAYKGQIVNVALLGSRTEVYLPVEAEVADSNVNSKLLWDSATNTLKRDATGTIELLGPVVDGIQFKNVAGIISYEDCKVAKVRL